MSRIISFALILALLVFLVSCAGPADIEAESTADKTGAGGTDVPDSTQPETDVLEPFGEKSLDGLEIRIHTSTNIVDSGNGMSSSNKYIEGSGRLSGDIVNDEVYERNIAIEETLGCVMKFTHVNLNYNQVLDSISVPVRAGEDFCDLIINDQYALVRAAFNGYLFNLLDDKAYVSHFNFETGGWYYDYMKELTVSSSKLYIMAGDFFIDVLRNAHALYFNTNMYTDLYGSPDELYALVEGGGWTYSRLLELVEGAYIDKNGDGLTDLTDNFGIIMPGAEGSLYPFIFSSTVRSVTFNYENEPSLITDTDRASSLCDTIMSIYRSKGANYQFKTNTIMPKFTSGESLFLNYFRIGDLEESALRSMKGVGLLPYPKLTADQDRYYTTVHDTAEMGAIPTTCRIPGEVSLLVQAMMRYTNVHVLPKYYETALKLKYAQDEPSSRMIDVIRNGITSPFELAYGYQFERPLYVSIRDSINSGSNIITSRFKALQQPAASKLRDFVEAFNSN